MKWEKTGPGRTVRFPGARVFGAGERGLNMDRVEFEEVGRKMSAPWDVQLPTLDKSSQAGDRAVAFFGREESGFKLIYQYNSESSPKPSLIPCENRQRNADA